MATPPACQCNQGRNRRIRFAWKMAIKTACVCVCQYQWCLICRKRSSGNVNRCTGGAENKGDEIETPKPSKGEWEWRGVFPLPSRLGEHCKLHQWGPGRSQGQKRVLVHSELQKRIWCIAVWYFLIFSQNQPHRMQSIPPL